MLNITFDENQSFNSITIDDNFYVTGFSTFIGPVDIDYLTVYQDIMLVLLEQFLLRYQVHLI